MDDEALLDIMRSSPRASERRAAACELLVSRHQGLVWSCVRPYLHGPEPAEDLMQVGYVGLLKAIGNFDPDAAGSNAAERSIQMLLEESMRVRVLQLDGGLDPDEYIAARGPEDYRKRAESADSYFHWLADRARSKFDTRTAEGRMDGFRTLLKPALEKIPDKLERLAIVNDLAGYLGVESRAILDQLKKTAMPATAQPRVNSPSWSANEQILIRCLLEEPNAAPVLAGLQEMESFRNLPSYGVLQSILSLSEDGDLRYESLDARLSESDR